MVRVEGSTTAFTSTFIWTLRVEGMYGEGGGVGNVKILCYNLNIYLGNSVTPVVVRVCRGTQVKVVGGGW